MSYKFGMIWVAGLMALFPEVLQAQVNRSMYGRVKGEIPYKELSAKEVAEGVLDSGISEAEVEKRPYRDYVRACVDQLIEYGTDRYGSKHTPMLVTILDVRSRNCPEHPDVSRWPWRGEIRTCFWKPRGAELLVDQSTIEVMCLLSKLTGEKKYKQFADRYLGYAMQLRDDKGFFWWGWHRFYDVFDDQKCYSSIDRHEIQINRPRWGLMWGVDEQATRRELELIWKWHVVDKETGEHNRHGDGKKGCDFDFSGGGFVYAFSFLFSKTGDEAHRKYAELVADHHWRSRDPKTNLTPQRPNAGKDRFDGNQSVTSMTGMLAYNLLKSYELVGVEKLRDQALSYLRAYARYGYDPKTGKFWGSLHLDGRPEPGPRVLEGYEAFEPKGYLDLWEPYQLGYEYGIYTAQAYAYAYQLTGEDDLLDTARKWADWIRTWPPSRGCRTDHMWSRYGKLFSLHGTFAGMYGRAISFFIHMYAVTGEKIYLEDARKLAREAVSKLYYQGLFRGHPAKPYYCSIDGVGFLLYALLQLDRVIVYEGSLQGVKGIPLGAGEEIIAFDNW